MSLQLYDDSQAIPFDSNRRIHQHASGLNSNASPYYGAPNAANNNNGLPGGPFSSSSSLNSLNFIDSIKSNNPSVERRPFREASNNSDAPIVSDPASAQSGQARTRIPSGAGAIGDGRRAATSTSVSSASSPDKAFSTTPLDIGAGSRPHSFILDPTSSPIGSRSVSGLPSLSLSTDDGATAKAFSPSSFTLSAGEPFFQPLRTDSPALVHQFDESERIRNLEQKVNDLSSLLLREVRSIREELVYLRTAVQPNRPNSSQEEHAAAAYLNFRSNSPRLVRPQGMVYPQQQTPQQTIGLFDDPSLPSASSKDETIAALTAQVNSLSASVTSLLSPNMSMAAQSNLARSPMMSPSMATSSPALGGPASAALTGLGMRNMRSNQPTPRHASAPFDDPRRRSALGYPSGNLRPDVPAFESGGGGWDSNSTPTSPMPGMTPLLGSTSSPHPGSLSSKWEGLGVGSDLFRSIAKYGLGPPTKVQMKAIPCVLRSQDCVVQVPAIQERIQAYTVPALQLISTANQSSNEPVRGLQAIIICATVDQAAQAQRLFVGLGGSLGLRTSLCTPASDIAADALTFAKHSPNILVGTPQKLFELLSQRSIPLNELRLLVIDECDQLLARNLAETVGQTVRLLLSQETQQANRQFDRQTAIFSCTVPQDVLTFASTLQLREPVRVLVRREGNDATAPSIRTLKQFYLYVAISANQQQQNPSRRDREWKLDALVDLLEDYPFDQAIVFCSSLEAIEAVSYRLGTTQIEALALHGEMGQAARQQVVSRFRTPSSNRTANSPPAKRCLCVHDAIARNLSDVHAVQLVINFDLPRNVEDYLHRTSCITPALNGKPGTVINVVMPGNDVDMIRQIEAHYRCKINELPLNQFGHGAGSSNNSHNHPQHSS